MTDTHEEIRASVQRLGWVSDCAVQQIGGSGNNRVFKLDTPARSFVLKQYFLHADDLRDRFATERAFYTFLWDSGVRRAPEPLGWDATGRLGLFEFIAGKRPEQPTREMVFESLSFFEEANRCRIEPAAASLPLASEACLSVREHLAQIKRRIDRLRDVEQAGDIDREAISFIQNDLTPAWSRLHESILAKWEASYLDAELTMNERCVSPSDFGFHNTIQLAGSGLRFLDFEYAGWDDPAKMVCDFFCQPAVPAPLSLLEEFSLKVATQFNPGLPERVKLLFPVYQIKWCCILLNEFCASGSRRRAFSNPSADPSERKKQQLEKAVDSLRQLRL